MGGGKGNDKDNIKCNSMFLFEEIFVIFGIPRHIVTNQGAQLTSNIVRDLTEKYKIKHRKSTPYHPKVNVMYKWNQQTKCLKI